MGHNPDFLMMQQPTPSNEWVTPLSYANDQANYTDDWLSCFFDQSSLTHIQPLSDFMDSDPSVEDLLCIENEKSLKKESHHVASPIATACHKQSPFNSLPEPLEHAHPFSATTHFSSTQDQQPEVGFVSAFPCAGNDSIFPQNSICSSDSQSLSCLLVGSCPTVENSSDVEAPALLGPLAQNSASVLTHIIQTSAPASAASPNSGLSQSSFVDSSSHQDFWKNEEMDAKLFADEAFAKFLFEPEEEIATSTVEIGSEEGQSIHTSEQKRASFMKGLGVGTELSKQLGMESMAAQVATAKRKHLGKRKKSSDIDLEDQQSDHNDTDKTNENGEMGGEDDEKRQARLIRNRESAQLSRHRRKVYLDELEEKLRTMTSTIAELNNTVGLISAENVSLRSQLAYFYQAHGSSAKPGVLPVGFPVVPVTHPGFVGARPIFPALHAPPVPIPRLKSQVPAKSSKKSKASAAGQGISKGSLGGRTKRLIGAAAMGFCLIMLAFAPMDATLRRDSNGSNGINQGKRIGGRVLMSSNQAESASSSSHRKWEPNISWSKSTGKMLGLERQRLDSTGEDSSGGEGVGTNVETSEISHNPSVDCCALTGGNKNHSAGYFHRENFPHNVSEPLSASLFVRRNDKLVKIDGSLIIQAIMAGDKAAQRSEEEESQKGHSAESEIVQKVAGQNLPPMPNLKLLEAADLMTLESPDNQGSTRNDGPVLKNQKALPSKQKVPYDAAQLPNSESSGSMQQWLLSDFAGTILSTGTCTKMFQFETSPVTGKSEANEPTASGQSTTSPKRSQTSDMVHSRRGVKDSVPLPPARQSTVGRNALNRFREKEKPAEPTKRVYRENQRQSVRTHPSSIVVSVLSEWHVSGDDGREQASGGSKGISNFLVVVLLDNVKYVTYSCMLPAQGPQPQLVTS